jgi:glycosyltransferase involved in cell wall biosynthesis
MRKRNRGSAGHPRVLIVGQGPPAAGGIPTFIAGLVEGPWLADRAHLDFLNTTSKKSKRPGAATASNFLEAVGHAWSVFRRARKVEVVHLNLAPVPTLPLLRAMVLTLAARAGGARVLLHAHTGRLQTVAASSRTYRTLLRLTLRLVDRLIVVSKAAEAAARPLGANVVRVDNGVDPAAFATGPKADPPILAFVGTVCERKGLIDLRDALLIVRTESGGSMPFDVQIVGDATQEGPGVFERVVGAYREAGLREVRFLGALPHDEVAAVLAAASVFCLPSHWEGFPLSLLEAMAAGCAPIASSVGDIPEILAAGDAGILVESKDVRALASAITRLAQDAEERTRLGSAARQRVDHEYSQARVVRGLLALYAGVSLPLE